MNELATTMAKMADFATNGITKGVDLILTNAPEIAKQFLQFKLFVHGFTTLLLVVGIIIGNVVAYKFAKPLFKTRTDYHDLNVIYQIGGVLVTMTAVFCTYFATYFVYTNFIQFMYIMIAPKVYLIEFFSKLIK